MCNGFLSSVLKFIDMLILMKNSFNSKPLNGLILFFSVWWYFEFVSSMFVRNVFIVIDKLIFFSSKLKLNMRNNVMVLNIFCKLEWVIKCSVGCVI